MFVGDRKRALAAHLKETFMKVRFAILAALTGAPLLAGAQVVLNASAWVPATHALSVAQKDWCEALEKETKGGVKCNILPKAVAAPLGTFDAVRDGLADISFAGKNAEATSVAYLRIYNKYFAPLGEHKGVKVLGVYSNPGHIFNTKKPVNTNADLASLKMRIPGGTTAEMAKLLGWNVALKPATEAYELMSTGVLDGTFITIEAIKSLNLTPVKYATLVPGGTYHSTQAFIMNQAKYDSLSPANKAAVDKLSGDFATRLFARGYDKNDEIGLAHMKATGVAIVNASPAFVAEIKAKIKPLEDKWVAAAEARGLKNARAVFDEFRAEAAKAN
jgi:TRAP-type C4-dicarboxylate transport system substrate-binding protein